MYTYIVLYNQIVGTKYRSATRMKDTALDLNRVGKSWESLHPPSAISDRKYQMPQSSRGLHIYTLHSGVSVAVELQRAHIPNLSGGRFITLPLHELVLQSELSKVANKGPSKKFFPETGQDWSGPLFCFSDGPVTQGEDCRRAVIETAPQIRGEI